jgi:hypothetical protein
VPGIGASINGSMQQAAGDRLGYTVAEFSRKFGHGPSWGYRKVYEGRVVAIQDMGDLRIPFSEIERILNSARRYDPLPKGKRITEESTGDG